MADLQLGLATLDELTGQFCGPLPDDPAPLRARLDEIETFTRDAATILSEIERDVAEWERTCEAGALKATQARYSNIWDCGIKNVAPEVASRLQSVWQTAEHADDAQKKAARVRKQAEAALDKAEAHADDARTRLSLGVRSAEARVRMQAEVHKAEEALERARTLVVDTGAKFDLPDSCLRDVMQKIAAAEAQIPGVPSGDMAEVPPRATTPPEGPREEEDPEVAGLIEEAKAAVKACRLQEALSIAREIERRAPGHPWLGLNMGRIESLADRQRLVVAAISAGRGSLSSGDTKGAMAHARRAASAPPPSCMADGVTDYVRLVGDVARKQAEEARAAAREASQRAAAAAAEALIGLAQVAQRVANRNRGTAPTAAPPRGDSSQRGNGQGGDSCAGRYHYVSEWNFTPECDCPGYTWNGQACVGSGGGRQDGGDRSDNRGTGGNHAILRIDRRYEETAVCGDPPYTVRLHSFTAYFKGTRDRLGQITAELGVGRNPGGWRKSGPCNCANWQTDSASTVQDNLSAQDAQSQWDRLPGQSWNFEVAIGKLAGAPGDNSTHRLNAAPCSMR